MSARGGVRGLRALHVFLKAAANTWAAFAEPRTARIWGIRGGGNPPPAPSVLCLPPSRAVGERCSGSRAGLKIERRAPELEKRVAEGGWGGWMGGGWARGAWLPVCRQWGLWAALPPSLVRLPGPLHVGEVGCKAQLQIRKAIKGSLKSSPCNRGFKSAVGRERRAPGS